MTARLTRKPARKYLAAFCPGLVSPSQIQAARLPARPIAGTWSATI